MFILPSLSESIHLQNEGDPPRRLISFTNHHFGPVRGLCFVVEGDECKDVDAYLKQQPLGLISRIWEATLLSTLALEFPLDLLEELEQEPPVVRSIEEGEKRVLERVHQGLNSGDPFFFRSFIL